MWTETEGDALPYAVSLSVFVLISRVYVTAGNVRRLLLLARDTMYDSTERA